MLSDTRARDDDVAPPEFDAARAVALAQRTFDIEAQALIGLKTRLGEDFGRAVRAMLACRGRVVVMGMGKSGHIGRKIAATLASTGTPALFVHPGEASHGDLGMVTPGDVVLAISNSGESDELDAIVPPLKRLGVTLVAMTGRADSSLARHADLTLNSAVDQEACPLNLAPTASASPRAICAAVLAVGARFRGQASLSTAQDSTTSATRASEESGRPVIATSVTPRRRSAGTMVLISTDSPELEMAITTSPGVTMPRSPWLASAG